MPKRLIDPYARLLEFRRQYPTQLATAKALGIAPSYLTDLIKRRRDFSARVLTALGLERTSVFVERIKDARGAPPLKRTA